MPPGLIVYCACRNGLHMPPSHRRQQDSVACRVQQQHWQLPTPQGPVHAHQAPCTAALTVPQTRGMSGTQLKQSWHQGSQGTTAAADQQTSPGHVPEPAAPPAQWRTATATHAVQHLERQRRCCLGHVHVLNHMAWGCVLSMQDAGHDQAGCGAAPGQDPDCGAPGGVHHEVRRAAAAAAAAGCAGGRGEGWGGSQGGRAAGACGPDGRTGSMPWEVHMQQGEWGTHGTNAGDSSAAPCKHQPEAPQEAAAAAPVMRDCPPA